MGIPEATTLPPSGSKKRAYEALEQRFGSTLQASTPQENKGKKSKASASRSRRRNLARGMGGRGDRDGLDADPSSEKVSPDAAVCKNVPGSISRDSDAICGETLLQHHDHHHLNHNGVRHMNPSQAMHRNFKGITQEFEAQNNGDLKRDVTQDSGEGLLGDPGTNPPQVKKKIPTNARFQKNCTQGVDDNAVRLKHPAYFGLSMTLDENLIKVGEKGTPGNEVGYSFKFMHDLLRNGDCSQKYMKGTQNWKFDDWYLLDNLVHKASSTNEHIKSLQSHSKRSKKHMSMKQHRKKGSFLLPQNFHSFDIFKPMHEMWKDYIDKPLKNTGKKTLSPCLLTADLHGAMLVVVECKSAAFTGIRGIMVRETTETFGIITDKNKFQVVPKKGSVFTFKAGSWKITLIGDEFCSRIVGK